MERARARASGTTDAEILVSGRARRAREGGFVRSFAYVSGPLYGYLLDRTGPEWRRSVEKDSDLGALLAHRANLGVPSPAEAVALADGWGGRALAIAEDQRERARAAERAEWKATLIDGPVLVIDLSTVTSHTFDPRKVHALGQGQIVYQGRTLVAPWGKLVVEGGAILEDRATARAFVSLTKRDWALQLEPGWALGGGERPGDQRIVAKP